MKREITITRNGKGLSKSEVNEVISTLRKAKAEGKLPSLTYEYNPRTLLFGKDPIYITPKTAPLERIGVKIRAILRGKYGSKYSVRLG